MSNADVFTHKLLRLVGDCPAQAGRIRIARILLGMPAAETEQINHRVIESFNTGINWTIGEAVELIDMVIDCGLIVKSAGSNPFLCLSRAGHRALDALENN